MAKSDAPLSSNEASGALNNIVYSSYNGSVVIGSRRPSRRKTANNKIASLNIFNSSSIAWKSLTEAKRLDWNRLHFGNLSGYHLFASRFRITNAAGLLPPCSNARPDYLGFLDYSYFAYFPAPLNLLFFYWSQEQFRNVVVRFSYKFSYNRLNKSDWRSCKRDLRFIQCGEDYSITGLQPLPYYLLKADIFDAETGIFMEEVFPVLEG